jgi:hypothetical protein
MKLLLCKRRQLPGLLGSYFNTKRAEGFVALTSIISVHAVTPRKQLNT